ncbi:hypothetical protein [Priestia megaterium]|uniref:hypothetical protein n=1 Tax=Priestia megaterium TaxID=1404 RepID=UPI003A8034EA
MMECIPTTVTNAFVSTLKTEQTLNLQITEAIRVFQQFFEKKPVGFFYTARRVYSSSRYAPKIS